MARFLAALTVAVSAAALAMAIDVDPMEVFTIRNANGLQADILAIGATIHRLLVPDRNGEIDDVVLGYDSPKHYQMGNTAYFGGIVGRVANRIANAEFILDNQNYKLTANDRGNTLHGGDNPLFENSTWQVVGVSPQEVSLSFVSPAGAQGFPGNLNVTVTYKLTDANELQAVIEATTDADTPVNLAQHSYFNLNGQARGNVLDHTLMINGDYVTPTDINQIPNGELVTVKNTPFDFTSPQRIGSRIGQVWNFQNHIPLITFPPPYGGYDHNWALFGLNLQDAANKTQDGTISEEPLLAVTLVSPLSGRAMDLSTNSPGLQFYSGNNLNGSLAGKGAYLYPQYGGLALESQVWPDFLHHPNFPQSILRPGQLYRHLWNMRFYNATTDSDVSTASLP